MEGLTAIRLRRQQILTGPEPPHLWVVVSEAALHQQVGGAEVMRGQMARLVEAADLDNVTLQVLP